MSSKFAESNAKRFGRRKTNRDSPKDKLDWLPSPAIGLETEEALLALVEVRDLARGGGGPLGLIVQDDDQIEVRQSIGGTLLEIGPLPRMQQTAG
jgi:hypothetical protein